MKTTDEREIQKITKEKQRGRKEHGEPFTPYQK